MHDGIVPQGETQAKQIWDLRENVALSSCAYGYTLKYDLSLGSKDFYRIVEETRGLIRDASTLSQSEKESIQTVGYGHIGDGNLHLNISAPGYDSPDLQEKLTSLVEPFVMSFVRENKGSISAEHGIGQQKAGYLSYSKSKPMIDYM
jgi:FAD/FMN-containing dehydrogenase